MATLQLLATTDPFKSLAFIALANICQCTFSVFLLDGILTESALIRLFVRFGLLARPAQMVGFRLAALAENLLTFRTVNPVKRHVQCCSITDFFPSVIFETNVNVSLFKCENMPAHTLFDRVVLCAENAHLVFLNFIFFLFGYVLIVFPLSDLNLAFTATGLLTILEGLDDVFSHARLVSWVEALSRLKHVLLLIIIDWHLADNTQRLLVLFKQHELVALV